MALKAYNKIKHAVRHWLRRLPTCKQTVKVISESMERRLSVRERIIVKLHLWICLWCVWTLAVDEEYYSSQSYARTKS